MKTLLAICGLVLANCAPPGDYKYHYEFECAVVESEFAMDEAGTSYKFDLGKMLFDSKFGPGAFCSLSKTRHYYVRNTCHFDELSGYANWDGTIQLEKRMIALNHELIHAYDGQHLNLGTSNHVGWDIDTVRYDGTLISNRNIGWEFHRAISPFPEAHEDGINLDELAVKTGTDGYECWEAQKNK